MKLPPLLVITDRTIAETIAERSLVDVVRAAVDGGAECVVLREKDLPRIERAGLAEALRAIVATVIVASDPTIESDGVHLASLDAFPPVRPRLVGRSCHSPSELAAAAAEGCDYATLSPIFASESKPGYGPPLGAAALRDPPLPVYALGGIDPSNARACLRAGAAGVAVMSHVMRADDPAAAVNELLS